MAPPAPRPPAHRPLKSSAEELYNPRLVVSDWQQIIARWQSESAAVRASARGYFDVPYGSGASQSMDIFPAEGASRGLMMFIHGGYWRALDKKDHSFIAPAFTRAGVTVALPNYSLCPAVTVEHIVREMLQATAWLYRNGGHFGAPYHHILVAGHSAGGHLTAMMMAALWPAFAGDLPPRVVAAGFSLSGLYDLPPLLDASFNEDVRLTPAVARRLSPAYLPPATDAPLYTAVGELENMGFHIQDELISQRWKSVHQGTCKVAGANHFTILDRLIDPRSPLHQAVVAAAAVRRP